MYAFGIISDLIRKSFPNKLIRLWSVPETALLSQYPKNSKEKEELWQNGIMCTVLFNIFLGENWKHSHIQNKIWSSLLFKLNNQSGFLFLFNMHWKCVGYFAWIESNDVVFVWTESILFPSLKTFVRIVFCCIKFVVGIGSGYVELYERRFYFYFLLGDIHWLVCSIQFIEKKFYRVIILLLSECYSYPCI